MTKLPPIWRYMYIVYLAKIICSDDSQSPFHYKFYSWYITVWLWPVKAFFCRCILLVSTPQSTYRVEMKYRTCICRLTRAYCTLQLCTWWYSIIEWMGVGVHSSPSPARADFSIMMEKHSIMMECTPEIGYCHSVCSLCSTLRWHQKHLHL